MTMLLSDYGFEIKKKKKQGEAIQTNWLNRGGPAFA